MPAGQRHVRMFISAAVTLVVIMWAVGWIIA